MPVSYTALLIAFNVIKGLAVILTLFRLGFRLKIQRLWWEDAWAAVALLCTVISIISVLAISETDNHEPILTASRIYGFMFTNVVWSVRMSLIFSIVRITPTTLLRRITLAVSAFFILFWVATLSLQGWWCVDNTQPSTGTARPRCVLPRSITIFEITINCGADTISAIFPLKLFRRVKLPQRQRRMLLSLFSANRFLCLFSLAHLIAQWVGTQSIQDVLANLQLGVFMIVCNLLVVVTYVYRVFLNPSSLPSGSGDPSDDDDFTTPSPSPRSTQNLTTVDLDSPTTSGSEISQSELKNDFFHSTVPSIMKSVHQNGEFSGMGNALPEIRTCAS